MMMVLNAHRRIEARRATLIGGNVNSNSIAMWGKDQSQQRIDFVNALNGEIKAGITDDGTANS